MIDADPRSHGLWGASAPAAPPTSPLLGARSADVAIIGAGYTGCSAALHLAQGGLRPIVLEAADIGFGGSGRNVGLVNAGMWVMPEGVPEALGETYGERLLDQLGDAPKLVFDLIERHGIDCEAERHGTLHCAVGAKGLAEIAERERQWRARGADVQLLDAAETARRVGSAAYAGSLLDRRAGTIQPLAYARGLARAAIEAGADIHTASPVLGQEDIGNAWRLSTPQGSVTAPWIIVATDAYSTHAWAGVKDEQVMLPYFNLATAPLPDAVRRSILPGLQGAWDSNKILSSFRLDRAGRLVFGSVGALRGSGSVVHRAWARRELARLFPQLEDVTFEHEWFGQIGMTDDALPRLHEHARQTLSISGYNGRGIAPGTTFGRDLARVVLGQADLESLSLPVTALTSANLRNVKAAFYEVGAQAAHLGGFRP